MRPDRPDGVSLRHYDGLGAVWTVKKASGRHPDPFGSFRTPFGQHRVLIARRAREENFQNNIPTYVPTFAGVGVNMSTSTFAMNHFHILIHPYSPRAQPLCSGCLGELGTALER